jgi:hypothetical protein
MTIGSGWRAGDLHMRRFGYEYVVHLQTGAIAESTTPRPRPNTARAEAIFLGAFDFGSEKRWQFIPASTRAERTVQ